jgi:hypothetical protein
LWPAALVVTIRLPRVNINKSLVRVWHRECCKTRIAHLPLPFINLMSLFRLPLMLLTLHSVWSTFPVSLPAVLLRIFQRITGMLYIKQPDYIQALSAQVKSLTFIRNRARWVICGNNISRKGDAHEIYAAVVHAIDACVFYPCRGTESRVPCL